MNLRSHPARVTAAVVAVLAAGTTTAMALTAGTASADEPGRCAQNVNVREEPASTARVVALCEAGTAVMLGEERDGWVFLDKQGGWASKDFLESDEAPGDGVEGAAAEEATSGGSTDGSGSDEATSGGTGSDGADAADARSAGAHDASGDGAAAGHADADHAAPSADTSGANGTGGDQAATTQPTRHRAGGLAGLLR